MQIQTPAKVNNQYNINKIARDTAITTTDTTKKEDDEKNNNYIHPYIPVSVCDNLIMQNVNLRNAIEILAEDMIYNDIIIQKQNNNSNNDIEAITTFWEDNEEELCNSVKDYISYGFGACEVISHNDNNTPNELQQISPNTLYIEKKEYLENYSTNEKTTYYYAVQKITGQDKVYLKLSHLEYPDDEWNNNLPVCIWIGKSRHSNFFDYPLWVECFNHVSASINLDLLDAKKINEGNLVSGILVIKRPPLTPNDADIDETLEEKMENHGAGLFTLDLESLNPDIPLTVDYIQINETNYQYLKELAERSDNKILATLRIPKARMLIDDVTESMNSNKTNTLYKIYTIELNNRQRPIEKQMRQFNKEYFGFDGRISIETPVFVDDKEIEANNTINIFNNGLITLGQAIKKVASIYPEFNEDLTFDENNPVYNERYYNGQPLGLINNNNNESIDFYKVSDFIDSNIIEDSLK